MTLPAELQTSVNQLRAKHTALIEAVNAYRTGTVGASKQDLLNMAAEIDKRIKVEEKTLLGQVARKSKKVPSLVLDFLGGKYARGVRRLDEFKPRADVAPHTRASTAGRFNSEGVYEMVAAGQLRNEYNPVTKALLGVRVEGERTNLIPGTDYWSQTWSVGDITRELVPVATPSGHRATLLVAKGGQGITFLRRAHGAFVGLQYTFSITVKKTNHRYVGVRCLNNDPAQDHVVFDFDTERFVFTPATEVVYKGFKHLGGGWYRISVTTSIASAETRFFGVCLSDANGNETLNLPAGASVLACDPQAEVGLPTSYTPSLTQFTSRASTGTYFDSAGVLRTAAADVARTNHAYVDGKWVSQGLLVEGQSTNQCLFSDTWGSVANDPTGIDRAEAPDMLGMKCFSYTRKTTGNTYLAFTNAFSSTGDQTITFSFYVKPFGGARHLAIRLQRTYPTRADFTVDMVTGAVTYSKGVEPASQALISVRPAGEGVWKVAATARFPIDGTIHLYASAVESPQGEIAHVGVVGHGFLMAGRQAEAGSQSTSYIPTAGSAVTRAADITTSAVVTRAADALQLTDLRFLSPAGTWHMKVTDTLAADLLVLGGQSILAGASGEGTVTLVHDTARSGKVYVDGVLKYSFTPFHGLDVTAITEALLAARGSAVIQNLKFYPWAMSAAEVTELEAA